MTQFDVHRNAGRSADLAPYLVVLQHDFYDMLATVIVAPALRLQPDKALTKVMPRVLIRDEQLFLSVPELFAIDSRLLGPAVGSLATFRQDIMAALDRLTTGV